uniref:DUF1618 domain-containing protein n=1 Tax=Oryza punctata TaxID=4537 RepID=A0A0E0KEP9_ORYPU
MERHSTPTPDWVLLSTTAVAGRHSNGTTAVDTTRNGNTIELRHGPGRAPDYRLRGGRRPPPLCQRGIRPFGPSEDRDYFVYRAHRARPSLHRLRRPHPYFNRFDVGVLPRSDGQYTVAALISTGDVDQYKLHLFHSNHNNKPEEQQGYWSCCTLTVEAPQREFPVKIPRNSCRIYRHLTTKVIAIEGEGGTMGWVGSLAWRAVLRCAGPQPLPARVDSWSLTTWTNTRMTDSYEDWHQERMIQASDMTIDNPAISQVLEACGFLTDQLALHNMQVSQPALCVNGEEEIVYLVARKKYRHPDSWILAVDVKNGKVQAVEKFAHRVRFDSTIIYCPSTISKYINPAISQVSSTQTEIYNQAVLDEQT